jgi:hypothetical protein
MYGLMGHTGSLRGGRGMASTHALIAVWIVAVIAGQAWIWRYQMTPGAAAQPPPASWPTGAGLPARDGRPLLVMVAHPRCVCTRASLEELRRLMARFAGLSERPAVYLSLIVPPDAAADWVEGSVLRAARGFSGLQVRLDPGGRLAARLGSTTSGHVFLYDRGGALLFSGGITSARGHEGSSRGQNAIVDALYRRSHRREDAPVFGCGLRQAATPG